MMNDWSRTAEQLMLAALESKIRVLAVTSVHGAAGVSTVAHGLVAALAHSGRKTLLLDMSQPVVAERRPVAWGPGEPLPPDAISVVADRLSILSVVASNQNKALFGNVELMQAVYQRDLAAYANIIIDLPAVADDFAEKLNPLAAARAADAVVLVNLTGLTNRGELGEATQKLRQVGANLTGLILNDQYCATLGEEIADVSYNRLGRTLPRFAHWIARKALASTYLNSNFRIVR